MTSAQRCRTAGLVVSSALSHVAADLASDERPFATRPRVAGLGVPGALAESSAVAALTRLVVA